MKSRREFIKSLSLTSAALAHPSLVFANTSAPFSGKPVITVQAVGAWDVTLFCDPKENQPGSDVITNWSKLDQTRTAGNLAYAPFASNKTFFDRHFDKTLVINGIDSQTNAHSIGETSSWSGRTAAGYPTLTALYAAASAPQLPMSYLAFGGFNKTAKLLRPTIASPWTLPALNGYLRPNIDSNNNSPYIDTDIWSLVRQMNASDAEAMLADEALIAGNKLTRSAYFESITNTDALADFAVTIPNVNQLNDITGGNQLIAQAHFALLAFKAGVSAAADLYIGGFDTHADNDAEQLPALSELTQGLDYLWNYAEQLGIDDRLVVIVGSDFSRTPYYNSGAGKDHWPIGSFLVMEKNAPFTNKIIGGTDEEQNALFLNPNTLATSSFSGTKLVPAHIHKALRKYLHLEASPISDSFPLINTESIDFFR